MGAMDNRPMHVPQVALIGFEMVKPFQISISIFGFAEKRCFFNISIISPRGGLS